MATQNLTSDGPAPDSNGFNYRSAESTFAFYGTWGGGSVTIEASFYEGLIWIPLRKIDGTILTVAQDEVHTISIGKCKLRYVLAGATGADINITIKD